jgi:hypothetical protein
MELAESGASELRLSRIPQASYGLRDYGATIIPYSEGYVTNLENYCRTSSNVGHTQHARPTYICFLILSDKLESGCLIRSGTLGATTGLLS